MARSKQAENDPPPAMTSSVLGGMAGMISSIVRCARGFSVQPSLSQTKETFTRLIHREYDNFPTKLQLYCCLLLFSMMLTLDLA
mmetsp:Transcript_21642/g.33945  ORF Transcript_21642/g.33945 Transcript_21642/m.33945 type:complete len:84 (-) Transcript_21642:55-306(-)